MWQTQSYENFDLYDIPCTLKYRFFLIEVLPIDSWQRKFLRIK